FDSDSGGAFYLGREEEIVNFLSNSS
ncbi:hypothetical protein F8388_011160, partial [Cannabis sativa]